MDSPKLNRCLFCGSSDAEVGYSEYRENSPVWVTCNECQADGPYLGANATEKGVTEAWNESYVAKALETLGHRFREGCHVRYFIKGEWRLMHGSQAIASGGTMLDMVMDLQDKVTK